MMASARVPMLNAPPVWSNQRLRVYHGTLHAHATTIRRSGVQLSRGQTRKDFGAGFYTTTVEWQARNWAWVLSERAAESRPAVLAFEIDRDALAGLQWLAFVRGDADADDFWSFVVHCRLGANHHAREARTRYDVVIGPVAAIWRQRVSMQGADQISFHTAAAEQLLNSSKVEQIW